jgi:hypothetical protein
MTRSNPLPAVAVGALLLAGLITSCGGSTTTVVQSTPPPQTVTQVTTAAPATPPAATTAAAPAQAAAPASKSPPNVVGLRLPEAKVQLQAAGYTVKAENTDTTFGIIVPSHYTICTQSPPRGNVVVVLAQKYGC